MTLGICLCKQDIMAQCVAENYTEQQSCDFFSHSSGGKRCMFRNETMNNHCWSHKAQDFSRDNGVVRFTDISEPELIYDESEELGMDDGTRRSCRSCTYYTSCIKLIDLAVAAASSSAGGLTEDDLWNQASSCNTFVGETKISISGGA